MKTRLLLLICLLASSVCTAKERRLVFRSFNADSGLAHNTVLAIIQDRTGFMWFGTPVVDLSRGRRTSSAET